MFVKEMVSEEEQTDGLPNWRPFYEEGWSAEERPAAQALWDWHLSLRTPRTPALDGEDLTAYFESEQDKVLSAEPLKVVPEDVWEAAYEACEAHDLPRELLAHQVRAARRLTGPVRFESQEELRAFLRRWVIPHGRLLAHLGDAAYTWQVPLVDELTLGFFRVGRLVWLPDDIEADRVFFPRDEREQYSIPVEALQQGRLDDNMRGFLWKQVVRARDHLGQGHDLTKELSGSRARAMRRWWMGAMELLTEIERREYDVWSEPPDLSRWQQWRIWLFSMAGTTRMRSR